MRTVITLLMAAAGLIGGVQQSEASQCLDRNPVLTVRIHDYVHVKGDTLQHAQAIASRLYRNIGVGIEWLAPSQMDLNQSRSAPGPEHALLAQLTINLLTSAMAARGHVGPDVLGFVAVPPEGGMGRIGYVVYQPLQAMAAGGGASEGDLLGVILAHDIGRLLLGVGSGSHSGVMKSRWDVRDLQTVNPLSLEFTPSEIARLGGTEGNVASSSPVGTRGSKSRSLESCFGNTHDGTDR